jgi:tetratricopeptide (TPR) repeat protein
LPEQAREALGIAAVGGRRIRRAMLVDVATQLGQGPRDALPALEAPCRAGLLVEEGGDAYQFAHDLIREVVLADLGAAQRALLHEQLAKTLEREPGEPPVELLAYHYSRSEVWEKAITYLERAGDRARAMYAHAEAEGYYRELVTRLDQAGLVREAAQTREKLGEVLRINARYSEALEVLERAIESYRATGNMEGIARTLAQIGLVHARRVTPQEGVRRVQALLAELGERTPSPGLAALYGALAHLYFVSAQYDEQLAASRRAEDLARALQDDRMLADAQIRRAFALLQMGRIEDGLNVLEASSPLAKKARDLANLCSALAMLGSVYGLRGEVDRGMLFIQHGLDVAEQLGDPTHITYMLGHRGLARFILGNWHKAHQDLERAVAVGRRVGMSWAVMYPLLYLGRLYLAEGVTDAASECLEEGMAMAERSQDLQVLRFGRAVLAERDLLDGDAEQARARLVPLLDRPGMEEWWVTLMLPHLARAHLDLGDLAAAEAAVVQAVVRARAVHHRIALADALRVQALVAQRQGRWRDAASALDETIAMCQAIPYPYAETKALYAYGQLHADRGEPQQARGKYEAALAICERLGEGLYRPYIERALARLVTPS